MVENYEVGFAFIVFGHSCLIVFIRCHKDQFSQCLNDLTKIFIFQSMIILKAHGFRNSACVKGNVTRSA
jgi:hypothetical protein